MSKLQGLHLSDFTGGLVTNMPPTELGPTQSPNLDNIVILKKGFKKRLGDAAFNATEMNSGANVQGLTYYKPVSATEYLVAVAGAKIFKSDSLDGTMDDITGAVTVTANQNNIWTFAKLNDLCIGVGGAPDAPFKWSGASNAAALGGSPVSGKFCFQARNRFFIGGPTANPSTLYWSILSNPEDWSGTGSGNTTVDTNDGDILVGGIPLNNNIALLFKGSSIHQLVIEQAPFPVKPLTYSSGLCGKNALVSAKGQIFFVTNEPRMKSTDGYSVTDYPDTIDDIWDGLSKSRLAYIQGIYDPINDYIHWICSNGTSSTNDLDIIWDLKNNCWLRNTTGWKSNVVCLASGYRIFGGHTNGKIYEKYKAGTLNDASETAPGKICGYWRSPWFNDENNITTKHPRYMDITYRTQTAGNIKWAVGFNYSPDTYSGEFSQISIGGKWDVDTWDGTFIWGGQSEWQKRVWPAGRGNVFQVKLWNDNESEAMQIHSIDTALEIGDAKDINTL